MSSPDERQGDPDATTMCYICSEISKKRSAPGANVALRPMESAESAASRGSAGVAEEQTVAPVAGVGDAVLPDGDPDQSALELGER